MMGAQNSATSGNGERGDECETELRWDERRLPCAGSRVLFERPSTA
jgi:hypothetical protein